jgi:capsular exopolysaccharide synthesis family protein
MGYLFAAINRAGTPAAPRRTEESAGFSPRLVRPPVEQTQPPRQRSDEPAPSPTPRLTTTRAELDPATDERMVALTDPSSIFGEEYRSIRTGILARWQQRRQLVHLITSATPQEGKTITSLNLGLSFAELKGRRTIVIEADLRLPQFASLLKLDPTRGLIGALEGRIELGAAIQQVGPNGLAVIAAGGAAPDRAIQLLSSHAMGEMLRILRRKFDHIIIDTPPVVELADAGILGAQADDVLMVVRMNQTPKPLIDLAIRALASYNAPVAGLIATDHPSSGHRYHKRYGYHYRYGANKTRAAA